MHVAGKSTVSNKGKERIPKGRNSDSDKGKLTVKPKPINKTQKVVPNVKTDVFTKQSQFEKGETSGVKSKSFYHKTSLDRRQNWIARPSSLTNVKPVCVDYIGKVERSDSESSENYVTCSTSESSEPEITIEEVYVKKFKKPKTKKAWVSLFN